jgi:hypothetical protein
MSPTASLTTGRVAGASALSGNALRNDPPAVPSQWGRESATGGEIGGPLTRCLYLPREVFFGRLAFAGAFFAEWVSDFGRFLPATSDSFPVDVLPGTLLR